MAVQKGSGTPAALQLAQKLMQEQQAVFVYRCVPCFTFSCFALCSDILHMQLPQHAVLRKQTPSLSTNTVCDLCCASRKSVTWIEAPHVMSPTQNSLPTG
jgi:hypothetical protein